MRDRIDYIYNNPVKRGFVDEPHHWRLAVLRIIWVLEDCLK